jgi:hypothetical protein
MIIYCGALLALMTAVWRYGSDQGFVRERVVTRPVRVFVELGCPGEDLAAIVQAFENAAIAAEIAPVSIRRSVEVAPWLIDIETSLKFLMVAAATGFGAAAGTDGWQGIKKLVSSLYKAREKSKISQGSVTLRDADTNVEIRLPPDLADEAYRRLYVLQNPRAQLSGILVWNNEAGEWSDAFSGKLRCEYPSCLKPATQVRINRPQPGAVKRRTFCDRHAAAADTLDPHAWSE